MKFLAPVRDWLCAMLHRSRTERDMDAELRSHIEACAEDFIRAGVPRAEALRRARLAFGGIARVKEECRESRGIALFESFAQDLRLALRMLRKSPGFTAVAILTLALGIGANVSMLGVVDALLFRTPEHVRAPQQLVQAGLATKQQPNQPPTLPYYKYRRLAARSRLVELAAEGPRAKVGFGRGAAARPIYASYVSHTYLQVLQAHMLLGRWFRAEEDQPTGSPPVVVLGFHLWQTAFEGNPQLLGRTVQIDGQERTVVGVAPRGFTGTSFLNVDAWLPICAFREISLPNLIVTPVGRLRNGATEAQAATELTVLLQRDRDLLNHDVVRVEPLFGSRWETLSSDGRVSLWIAGVALIVFLMACMNVSSLGLARMAQRQHEMAIRQHLGATRARVMQQVLIEGLLLGALGGLAALLVALMAQPLVRAFLLPNGFYEGSFLSRRLLATAAALAAIAGCGSGLAPAWRASDWRLAEALKRGVQGRMRQGFALRWALVAAQIALASLLAVGAGLLIRSLRKLDAVNLGFQPKHLLQVTADLPVAQGPNAAVSAGATYARLRARAEQVPGVADAALANMLTVWTYFTVIKKSDSGKTFRWTAMPRAVTPNYFQTMGIPIWKGRPLLRSDIEGSQPAVVVSQSVARAIWPGQNPLGKCMRTGMKPGCALVVGVVPDAWPTISPGGQAAPGQFYVPLRQAAEQGVVLPAPDGLLVRTKADALVGVTTNLFSALESVSPSGRYVDIEPFTKMLDEQTRSWRMAASMFSLFGALALALAAVGIYGVMAFLVRQRTHEIGVRMAFGAQRGDILRTVIREGMLLAGIGIIMGIAGALALTRFLRSLLFEIKPTDPTTFIGVAILLALVALLACYIPARRAMRVDPMVALRHE